jgi:hypothetical protein
VIVDILLFRILAYRHLFCNRFVFTWQQQQQQQQQQSVSSQPIPTTTRTTTTTSSATDSSSPAAFYWYMIQYSGWVGILVRTHICIVASHHNRIDVHHSHNMIHPWMFIAVLSFLGYCTQILVCMAMIILVDYLRNYSVFTLDSIDSVPKKSWLQLHTISYIGSVVALSIILPSCIMYVLTAVIHMWENSILVRHIGSALLLLHQYISWTVIIQILTTSSIPLKPNNNTVVENTPPPPTSVLVVLLFKFVVTVSIWMFSLLLRGMVMEYVWTTFRAESLFGTASNIDGSSMPCPGLYWTFHSYDDNNNNNNNVQGTFWNNLERICFA